MSTATPSTTTETKETKEKQVLQALPVEDEDDLFPIELDGKKWKPFVEYDPSKSIFDQDISTFKTRRTELTFPPFKVMDGQSYLIVNVVPHGSVQIKERPEFLLHLWLRSSIGTIHQESWMALFPFINDTTAHTIGIESIDLFLRSIWKKNNQDIETQKLADAQKGSATTASW